ncbi:MAG: class B sortase [Tissierellales bacterium]|nr:class B sortase [Tissierellales bacterium]MBN2828680.1 class B sortase [Tissierellales bacterium]
MNSKKIISLALLTLSVIFAALVIYEYMAYKASDQIYEEARIQYEQDRTIFLRERQDMTEKQTEANNESESSIESTTDSSTEVTTIIPSTTTISDNPTQPTIDKEIAAQEGNVMGWISIEGTKIDYPVVQTTDNEYYLTHNYLGKKDVKGAIYMDFRNNWDSNDRNLIIYGHKMIDGTMFSDLSLYVQEGSYKKYFSDYGIITLDDFESETEWQIFSAYVVNLGKEDYYLYTKYRDDSNYQEFIDEIQKRSIIKSGIEVTLEDRILTLVTCNFWYDNARVIIHAVKQN